MSTRLENTAPHRIRRELEVHVAGVLFRPRIQNADHRLPNIILCAPARLLRPRAMSKRAEFITAIPAPGAELFRSFASHAGRALSRKAARVRELFAFCNAPKATQARPQHPCQIPRAKLNFAYVHHHYPTFRRGFSVHERLDPPARNYGRRVLCA